MDKSTGLPKLKESENKNKKIISLDTIRRYRYITYTKESENKNDEI